MCCATGTKCNRETAREGRYDLRPEGRPDGESEIYWLVEGSSEGEMWSREWDLDAEKGYAGLLGEVA